MLTGLTQYVPEATLTIYDNLEFLLRLLLSAALGALVGLERSKRRKEAGIRTHCIIACTSALFMIVSKYAFLDCLNIDGLRGADPARIAAQVVSGISFLGAGVIFKNGNSIRGLTTAAGMWGTAAIGMAVGAGMYWLGLFESAVLVAIQVILHRFPVGDNYAILVPVLHLVYRAMVEVAMSHQNQVGRQVVVVTRIGVDVDHFALGSDDAQAGLTHV